MLCSYLLKSIEVFNKYLAENVGNSISGESMLDFVHCANEVKRNVEVIISNSSKQRDLNILSGSQKVLYEFMATLCTDLKSSFIYYKGERLSLWEIPKEIGHITTDQFEFNDIDNIKRASEVCKEIISLLQSIIKPSNFIKTVRCFFTDSTLGSLNYVKICEYQ